MKNQNAITLISLIITIIVLLILAGVVIALTLNNGIIDQSQYAVEENSKQTATEKINLKITNSQMQTYAKEQRMPTLQEVADNFCQDNEIEYVELVSKKTASLNKIEIGNNNSFFTKLKEYPYEFEINSSLQLASIDGIKIATNDTIETSVGCNPKLLTSITLPSTGSNARAIGEYYANTTSFRKVNTDDFTKYLSFDETKGWTVLKSGYYMIVSGGTIHYYQSADTSNYIIINEEKIDIGGESVRTTNEYDRPYSSNTIYLEKGSVINFENYIGLGKPIYHSAYFCVYALFR